MYPEKSLASFLRYQIKKSVENNQSKNQLRWACDYSFEDVHWVDKKVNIN